MISDSFMMRLISLTIRLLTHTAGCRSTLARATGDRGEAYTLFADQRVVAVVGVVGIARHGTATIAENAEVKF